MHAYLFTGSEGAGKMTTAVAFAAALNCEDRPESGDSCGVCLQCRMTFGDGHPDIDVITPDSAVTSIKQMREMKRTAQYAPVRGKWKVVIIEQADTLNEDSANCILKILEEPPHYLVIILLSRNPSLMLPTIKSRCMQVRFPNVPADQLAAALIDRFEADEEQARFLAAYSEGRPGAAISILRNENFQAARHDIIDLADKIAFSDEQMALRLSEELQKLVEKSKGENQTQRAAMRNVLDTLVLWYRDLLNIKVCGESAQLINADLRDRLSSLSLDVNRASKAIETLIWARKAVEGNANVQLISDILMMRLTA